MKNLTIKLETYLLNWYCALPTEALNEIHFGEVDFNAKDELQDDWHNGFDLEDKIAYHDDLYDKYHQYTKDITLCETE